MNRCNNERTDPGPRDLLKEFVTTDEQAKKIREVGGIVGLRTGPNHIKTDEQSNVANDCAGSSKSYAQLVSHAKSLNVNIAFGSDFNGVTQQIAPRYGSNDDRCYAAVQTQRGFNAPQGAKPEKVAERFNRDGLKHIGYLPDLYDDLVALKTNNVQALNDGAEKFIQMWEKQYDTKIAMVTNKGCKADTECAKGEWCDAGVDLKGNVCRALKKDGESCPAVGGGHACNSGNCKYGKCYTPESVAMGGSCFVEDQCKVGKCNNVTGGVNGTCVCKEDSDCGPGKWCDGGLDLKLNACHAKLNKGQSCGKAGSLGNDHKCKSGNCSGFPKYVCK